MSAQLTKEEKNTYRIGASVIDMTTPPETWNFSLDDVQQVLQHLPRYLGGSRRSVWEHSLSVADRAQIRVSDWALEHGRSYCRYEICAFAYCRGLYHDASEAFTGDVPGPIKQHLGTAFKDFERRIQDKVYEMAGCSTERIVSEYGTEVHAAIVEAVEWADAEDYREEQKAMHQTEPEPIPERPPYLSPRYSTSDLLSEHVLLTDAAYELMQRKNNDYAGSDGTSPFKNFLHSETLGLCSVEQGMVVRLSDKLQRLAHAVSGQEMQVTDETVKDTILDIINYAVLISAYLQSKAQRRGC